MLHGRPAARCAVLVVALQLAAAPGAAEAPAPDEAGSEAAEEVRAPDEPASPDPDDAVRPQRPLPDPEKRPDPANVEPPVFPTYRVAEAFRVRVASRFVPSAAFDSFDVDLYEPEVHLRATVPLSLRAAIQLTVIGSTSRYDFSGGFDPFGLGDVSNDPFDDFYRTTVVLQGGFRVNDQRFLFVEDEIWSVLANVLGRARWEAGAFSESLTGGATLAMGYEIPELIRVGLGATLQTRIDGRGIRVSPVATLRWDVTKDLKLRSRGAGAQVEYNFSRRFEVFAAGFYDADVFRLEPRPGIDDDLTFRDEGIYAALGLEWKISRHLRLNIETGAVTRRKLEVRSHGDRLFSERGDPSAYLDVRFELRP
jgi:hypothetical protein